MEMGRIGEYVAGVVNIRPSENDRRAKQNQAIQEQLSLKKR
jgi:hypothetical protein